LDFVTGSNIGSRLYLMQDDSTYQIFKLLNQEFTFDVDVSSLPCGLNGALYFVAMDADGGMSKYDTNKAGAKYGTGYCDSQCPRDLKFINGQVSNFIVLSCLFLRLEKLIYLLLGQCRWLGPVVKRRQLWCWQPRLLLC
jgi:hypothetical protein